MSMSIVSISAALASTSTSLTSSAIPVAAPLNNNDTDGGDPVLSSYMFPTTMIQVAVATICPGDSTQAGSGSGSGSSPSFNFSMSPTASNNQSSMSTLMTTTATAGRAENGIGDETTATDYLPVQVNATAVLADGRTTVFLSTSPTTRSSAPAPAPPSSSSSGTMAAAGNNGTNADSVPTESNGDDGSEGVDGNEANNDVARIIFDPSGCQTIYSPVTTQICSTTVKPGGGMVPVQVTDCDQWVTFSSELLPRLAGDDCSATPPTATAAAATADDAGAGAAATGGGESLSSTPTTTTATAAYYYAAHWYDLAAAAPDASSPGVPGLVRVEKCLPLASESGSNCVTSSESWSVASSTRTTTKTSVAGFSGPVIITSGTNDTTTTTTTLSLPPSTITTTIVLTEWSIVRSRFGGGDSAAASTPTPTTSADSDSDSDSDRTVTVAVTMPTTKTWLVESVISSITSPSESQVPSGEAQTGGTGMTTVVVRVRQTLTTTLGVTETQTRILSAGTAT
ncbi:hypothetical protein LTR67_005654 [Exophiala xenobiotica]